MRKMETKYSSISPLRELRFSSVCTAESSGKKYFLKSSLDSETSREHFLNEINFHKKAGAIKRVVPLLDTCEISGQDFLVYPFIEKDLLELVGKVSSQEVLFDILMPLLDCLESVHLSGFVHADIKLENIRLDDAKGIKVFLSDFGRAVEVGSFVPHQIGSLSQHIPPDTVLTPQLDLYSIGVATFQLLFGLDFIKKFQMAGRKFQLLPESQEVDPLLLRFIEIATESSAVNRFKDVAHARSFLKNEIDSRLSVEKYNLDRYFEFYLECMRDIFIESQRSTADYEQFIGPWGEKYYHRLKKWNGLSTAALLHLKAGNDLVGICEATIRENGTGLISSIYLRPQFRGQGGAQILERAIIEFFSNNGVFEVHLNVTETNERAIAFYRKQGWEFVTSTQYPGAIQFVKKI
ncbi:N-acetyltransferase [Bdellovibrio sp. HCB2-146]|uniref:N-acetyltransferase n=1 Tax=Bdellovibrio sp. HCB2-146 TaxID=3394362 RepID=UPI0039BD716A